MLLNKKLLFKLFLILLCVAANIESNAQFWKKDPPPKKVMPVRKPAPKPEPKAEKKKEEKRVREMKYPESVKKERYQIDVLIPLYLDELVKEHKVTSKGKLPEKAQAGIAFFEGIKLAVDTLKNMGYQTDIVIHDITSKGNTVAQLIAKDSLIKTDLIIGFVSSQQVDELAAYAEKKKVNFVSAFSPSDANVKANPYFILTNPTLQNNCEAITKSIAKKPKEEKLFLFYRTTNNLDSAAYEFVRDDSVLDNAILVRCNTMPDSATLSRLIDTTKTNRILMPIMDNNYSEMLIEKLAHFRNAAFEIYGMPTWKNITSTKKMTNWGNKISIFLTQPYHFDFTDEAAVNLANKYKAAYGGKPSELSFRGYELTCWMTDLLNKYGAIFNEKMEDNSLSIFTKYDIKPKWDKENNLYYLENKHLYVYKYQAGLITVEKP